MRGRVSVTLGALTDQGKVRDSNEDRSFYCKFDLPGDSAGIGLLAAVADGMGGHAAGEAASERAVQVLQSRFCGLAASGSDGSGPIDWIGFMKETIEQANVEVYEEAGRWEGRTGMGTTLTAVAIVGSDLYVGHVGDSRAYLMRNGSISQITEDDTWTADQVRRGLMTEAQATESDKAGQLMQALGRKKTVRVYACSRSLDPSDTVLIATDGLTSVVSDREMLRAFSVSRTPQSACERLVALANRRGGPDNMALVAAAYGREALERQSAFSRRSVRRAMIAGLAAVLALLAVDAAYIASHYADVSEPRLIGDVRSLQPRDAAPSVKRKVPVERRLGAGAGPALMPLRLLGEGRRGPTSGERPLSMKDMSGDTVTLSEDGGKR